MGLTNGFWGDISVSKQQIFMAQKIKEFVIKHFEGALLALILIGVLIIVFFVPYKFSFLNFFFIPVILAGVFWGKNRAVLTAVFCVLVVILYRILVNPISDQDIIIETVNLAPWSGFLIITGALIGYFSEQRESKLHKLRNAYVGVLEIMLKYLESADEEKPTSLRVAHLAGRIAAAAGLETRDIENIKSASLLSMAGDLSTSMPLFLEMTDFLSSEGDAGQESMGDREKVLLKSTSSLLKEVEPLLTSFDRHYIQNVDEMDKDLSAIPLGSCIMALAQIYDKIVSQSPPFQGKEEYKNLAGVQNLSGHSFHSEAVEALILVVTSP